MTNGIVSPPLDSSSRYHQTTHVQEVSAQSSRTVDLRYDDGKGNAFHLSLSRETSVYSLTYDSTARVQSGPTEHGHRGGRGELRDELKELRKEVNETAKLLRDAGLEVKGFKRLLHRMLKAVDRGYREHYGHFDPVERETFAGVEVHARVVAVEAKFSLSMDRVDPEYWSAENTAQRLTDFALGLYEGGDRAEHAEKMIAAMEQGYGEARQAFGGALPEIARETLEIAADRLSQWAETPTAPAEGLQWVA